MTIIGKYKVEIFAEETFESGFTDNKNKYDFEYLETENNYISTYFCIKLFENEKLIKSIVIGSEGGKIRISENIKVIEENRIIICCGNKIFCLSLPELKLMWKTKADDICCFEVYKKSDFYIVHGEIEISKLDNNGKILWHKSGADIFTPLKGADIFELNEKYIIATDWENRIYKFDYDGNEFTDMTQFLE
ncbi:hypothetical protein MW871_16035 [Flavobacterium sp. I-SCBP12n]|uniref:Uncharacterized protein n=1 Tax=Flavobacterium pygoscelis TaxID=2893176 RepID=A0A9X1XUD7_9FLAO|nr:hypothetical protein [Flavobacterium pygoscelis]MCK8143367.1 hypothetical protein [Flavobacterium pygoscelis]MCK8143402.1 hypothetical protein [Flavobacterium pygoscelis]